MIFNLHNTILAYIAYFSKDIGIKYSKKPYIEYELHKDGNNENHQRIDILFLNVDDIQKKVFIFEIKSGNGEYAREDAKKQLKKYSSYISRNYPFGDNKNNYEIYSYGVFYDKKTNMLIFQILEEEFIPICFRKIGIDPDLFKKIYIKKI